MTREIFIHSEEQVNQPTENKSTVGHLLETITERKSELAENVRAYSKAHSKLWRLVPSLYLEIEGRTGYSNTGAWVLTKNTYPLTEGCYVELTTGDIVHYPKLLPSLMWDDGEINLNREENWQNEKAPERKLIALSTDIKTLDAYTLVKNLAVEAQKPYGSWVRPDELEDIKKWRSSIREEHGISVPDFKKVEKTLAEFKKN